MTEKEYGKLMKDMSPKSPIGKDCLWAFLIGGLICAIGQLIKMIDGKVVSIIEKGVESLAPQTDA